VAAQLEQLVDEAAEIAAIWERCVVCHGANYGVALESARCRSRS
jgi:hypothetical protein